MLAEIRKIFEGLEEKHKELLRQLEALSAETLYFKAGADKWSIVEVVEHLVITEDDMLDQLSGVKSAVSLDPGERSDKKFQTVIKVMEKDIEVDVPDESMKPQGQLKLEELLERWETIRKETQIYINGISPEDTANLVYRHPFAGPLDLSQTLRFVDVHFDNHMRHIETIRARTR